jgi:hypothetical protein
MFKFFIKIILIFFLTVFNINALTFKNDGSIVSSNGVIIKESSYKRYQKALEQYFNGETVSDWPTVDLNKKGKPQKKKGFFGEKILKEGAPLFELPRTFGNNVVDSIAIYNGLTPDDFTKVLVSQSNDDWQIERELNPETIELTKDFTKNLVSSGFETFKLYQITEDIFKYEIALKNPTSDQYFEIGNKLKEFFGFENDDVVDEFILTIQNQKIELDELELNRAQEKILLQAELKKNIERITDNSIDDFGSTSLELQKILEEENEGIDNKIILKANYLNKELTANQIALNIENYKDLINSTTLESNNKLTEEMIAAISSWEETPGGVIDNFLQRISVEGLELDDINEISKEFNESVRKSIELAGDGDLDLGLKNIKLQELQNEFSKMASDQFNGLKVDEVELENLREEVTRLEEDLGTSVTESFGNAYFEDCDCIRDVTQEDRDNMDPETGQFQ